MLEHALVLGDDGQPLRHKSRVNSQDWDEVQEFCRTTYMPYRVRPLERYSRPDSTMISRQAGRVTVSRFAYGTGVHLSEFDPEAGNILVLNTLQGAIDHHCDDQPATTTSGESFVVDCSRTDYWLKARPDHLQLNLTIPHHVMEEVAKKWFGHVPNNALWTSRVKFGGAQSRWMALLDYVSRSLGADHLMASDTPLGRHLEEMICLDLLQEWAAGCGIRLDAGARAAAPHYVRQAEELIESQARQAPSIGDIALHVGVSARTLSEGFRRFRGVTPREFLAARRLEGLRRDLLNAADGESVTHIAAGWGFVNKGAMAGAYKRRFGELPSHTLSRKPVGF